MEDLSATPCSGDSTVLAMRDGIITREDSICCSRCGKVYVPNEFGQAHDRDEPQCPRCGNNYFKY